MSDRDRFPDDIDSELLMRSHSTGADSGYLVYPAIEHIPSHENVEFAFHNKTKGFKMVDGSSDETLIAGDDYWNIVVITDSSIHLMTGGVDGEEDKIESIHIEDVDDVEARTGVFKNKLIIKLKDGNKYSKIRIPVQSSDEVNQASEFMLMEPEKREQSQVGAQVWDLEKLYSSSPDEFESIIADLWRDKGYAARTTQASNDMGVDVSAEKGEQKVLIQAKRYRPMSDTKVGIDTVQRTAGLLTDQELDATSVVVATTANFTNEAKERGKKTENMQLLSGVSLADELRKSNVPPEKYGGF